MTGKPARDDTGRFKARWRVDLEKQLAELRKAVGPQWEDGKLRIGPGSLQEQVSDLRSRIGTSTPLIIWNIAVLIALAGIAAKVWGYAPY